MGVGEEAAFRARGSGQQGQFFWKGQMVLTQGRSRAGHWERRGPRSCSLSVGIPQMVLRALQEREWDEGGDRKVCPWPSPCPSTAPAPSLLAPQVPTEPLAVRNRGPALQWGDQGQTGPGRLGLLVSDTLGSRG